jgi:RNA polymerase sigma-70 factor, ECF subfamily
MTAGSSTERAEAEFRRLLPMILPRLNRFALALTRARAEADDVLQAACERAFSHLDKWDPDTRLDSWMFRIMQTIWWNELRARKVRERHIDRARAGQTRVQQAEAEAQLLLVRAEQEIFRLPDELRIVLLLVCVEQLSYREAAEVASIPIGTVMSRLARARLLLMQRLGLTVESRVDADGPLASISDELIADVGQRARA